MSPSTACGVGTVFDAGRYSTSGEVKYGCVVYLWIFSVYAGSTGCLGSRAGAVSPSAQAVALATNKSASAEMIRFIEGIFTLETQRRGSSADRRAVRRSAYSMGRKVMQTGEGACRVSPVGVSFPVEGSTRNSTM